MYMSKKRHTARTIRIRILTCIFILFTFTNVFSQGRQKITVNSNWYFQKGDGTQDNWELINIPHTWNVTDTLDDEPGYYRGVGEYKKVLSVPSSWKNKKVFLFFEGANQTAKLFVNNVAVGTHLGGYTAFRFDISKYLQFGMHNEIKVQVNNAHDDTIAPVDGGFTFLGGIYRDVFLEIVEPVHFDMNNLGSDGIFITTPEVSSDRAKVMVKGSVTNDTGSKKRLVVKTSVIDPTGKIVASSNEKLTVNADGLKEFEIDETVVANPQLWSPKNPNLYRIKVQLVESGSEEIWDEILLPLGFRWYGFNERNQFLLNGEPLFLKGINRHQDYMGLGNAVPDELHLQDMRSIKEMGCNFVRLAHYPQERSVLDACDRLGLIVWEEIPIVTEIATNEEFQKNSVRNLREMIRQHYNHPSLIMAGYMNEVLIGLRKKDKTEEEVKTYIPHVKRLSDTLHSVLKEESPQTLSVIAFENRPDRYRKAKMLGLTDLEGWNIYSGWYGGDFKDFGKRIDKITDANPNTPIIVSEYGAGSDPRIHASEAKRFDFSAEYSQTYHREILEQIAERPSIAGVAIWCFADFYCEPWKDAVPHINNKGVVAFDRTPKDVFYFYKSRWNDEPMIHIGTNDWHYQAGLEQEDRKSVQKIKVFSNLAEVEFFIGNTSLGKKRIVDNSAVWEVPFTDGKNRLRAIGVDKIRHEVEDFSEVDFDVIPKSLHQIQPLDQINVNLGAHFMFTDQTTKNVYLPDQEYQKGGFGYVGGVPFMMNDWRIGSNINILNTEIDPVYQTQRVGLDAFRFDVPDGQYELTLHFADLHHKKTNNLVNDLSQKENAPTSKEETVFHVLVNGKTIHNSFDLGKENFAMLYKINVTVNTNEGVNISFDTIKGEPVLNAINLKKTF